MYESLPPESCKVIALDIDSHNTIVPTLDKLISFLVDSNFSEIQTHILYGGSLAASVNQDESELNKLTRVFHHNSIVPMFITQYMIRHLVNSQNSRSIHFCYYLSAVTQHLKASPDYVGAKAALEGILREFVFKHISNTYFSGFRLGFVPIDHKFLGKLRMEDSDSYRAKLVENVPSLYTPDPNEVANFIFQTLSNSKITNGMICDISGGNSWI